MPSGSPTPQRRRNDRIAVRALAAVFALLAAAAAADERSQPLTIPLDSTRSRADFEVKVLWLIGVHGRFGQVRGTVTLDRFHGTVSADARIDVETITMRNHNYEQWVKSDEFFDAAHYPQIHFLSDSVPVERLRSGGEISGVLSVRGVSQPVRLQIEPSACVQAIASACAVEASGTIRRSDFGMHSRRGTLSDKVDLGFSIYLAAARPEPGRGH